MLTICDLYCGAGGSTAGAVMINNVVATVASNHWDRAIETHSANHPNTDHIQADLSQIDPRLFPTTDLLWASPSCTKHSIAQGRKRQDAQPDLFGEILPEAAAERSRATCRFSTLVAEAESVTCGFAEFSSRWRTSFSQLRGGSEN